MRSAPYQRYAEVYDRIGQRRFGERIASAILPELAARRPPVRAVADLACGTGAAALVFATAGYDVLGVDRSPEMLARAREAAEDAGAVVHWLCQDLRDLALESPVDLATSFYDSLNYITEADELARIFIRVAGALHPDGLFVFDLNTIRRLSETWADACMIAADENDLFVSYRSWYDESTHLSPLLITGFVRIADGSWRRFDEEHIERGYSIKHVAAMLAAAGFARIDAREYLPGPASFAGEGTEASSRVVFFAEREA